MNWVGAGSEKRNRMETEKKKMEENPKDRDPDKVTLPQHKYWMNLFASSHLLPTKHWQLGQLPRLHGRKNRVATKALRHEEHEGERWEGQSLQRLSTGEVRGALRLGVYFNRKRKIDCGSSARATGSMRDPMEGTVSWKLWGV